MKTIIYFSLFIVLVSSCHCQHDVAKNDTKLHTSTTSTTKEAPNTTLNPHSKPIENLVEGNITNNKKEICLRYHFILFMKLAYTDKNETVFENIYLPYNAKVNSDNCYNDKTESFSFEFGKNSSLNLTFEQNEASIYLASIFANIFLQNDSNKSIVLNITKPNPNFNVDKSHSYVCVNNVTITADDQLSELLFSNVTIQAFMKPSQKGAFSKEHNCQKEINDVVPIAVGAALTSLVIIVMIAYFIGRRRSRRLAYQSV